MDKKRWADPGDLKRCFLRSRRRVGSHLGLGRAVRTKLVGHQLIRGETMLLELY
jgi:hypothetical protein